MLACVYGGEGCEVLEGLTEAGEHLIQEITVLKVLIFNYVCKCVCVCVVMDAKGIDWSL